MQTDTVARLKLFNMRMNESEWARVERLADHYGLDAAGLIRFLLKRDDDALEYRGTRESGQTSAMSEAAVLVTKAAVPGVKLLVQTLDDPGASSGDRADIVDGRLLTKRFALTDGKRTVRDLDLVGVERALKAWPKSVTKKGVTKGRR